MEKSSGRYGKEARNANLNEDKKIILPMNMWIREMNIVLRISSIISADYTAVRGLVGKDDYEKKHEDRSPGGRRTRDETVVQMISR